MVPLARRNLLAEKGRFAMSVAGVAFAVLLVLIVVGLYRGWSDAGRLYEQLPGELWVSQEATSDPFHSTSFLPEDAGAALRAIGGVRAVFPVYARHISFANGSRELDVFVMAFDVSASTGGQSASADAVPPPGTIEIDRVLAGQAHVGVGDVLRVLDRDLRVIRVHSGGNSVFQTAYLNASDARALFGFEGLVNFFVLDPRPGASLDAIAQAARVAIPRSDVNTSAAFAQRFAELVNAGFLSAVQVLVGIGLVVGGGVVALTTYTATAEKAREFGVLKAVGASPGFLYRVVVQQSLAVGVLGALLGIGAAVLTTGFVGDRVPEFLTELRAVDVALVFAAALGMAAVAALVPVRRINRIDPGIVFRA